MRVSVLLAGFLVCGLSLTAQTEKPAYCNDGLTTYGSVVGVGNTVAAPGALPAFTSLPTMEYKVQVAILRYTDPKDYPFHPTLVARYRPCEEVWVVESRESFADRAAAVSLQTDLRALGYEAAFITELVGYQ